MQRLQRDLRRVRGYLESGNHPAAQAAAESLTRQFPGVALGWFWRSLAEAAVGNLTAAVSFIERAARLDPERPEVFAHAARCHFLRSDAHLALKAAHAAAALSSDNPVLLDQVAAVLTHFGAAGAALPASEKAAELDPKNPLIAFNLGTVYRALGRHDEALAQFERALELAPGLAMAHWAIAESRTWPAQGNHVERMQAARALQGPGSETLALLEFAIAKELDDAGAHDQAFAALERGNAIMRERLRIDHRWEETVFTQLERQVEATLASAAAEPGERVGDAPIPIFILGMPRAGGALVERLLGNHPEVRLGGELQDFNVCVKRELGIETAAFMNEQIATRMADADWQRVGAAYRERLRERFGAGGYVTDKLPGNHFFVHAIAAALPEARIIHVIRDPLDTCFAIYREMFGTVYPFAYEQQAVAGHYVRYAKWMRQCELAKPKRIFPLRYEQMVSVPGLITRALYRYCGLDWVEGAEDPTANDKPVATANPVLVRDRVHSRGIGAWQPYATNLAPMREVLSEAGLISRD
jgi:tetratricopeptide (TPR) repeat protein